MLLFTTKLPNYFIFMLGCVFALVVNFPDPKEQEARLAAHAPKAISLVATVLAAGVMVGILNNTGMIVAMAEFIINILPPHWPSICISSSPSWALHRSGRLS